MLAEYGPPITHGAMPPDVDEYFTMMEVKAYFKSMEATTRDQQVGDTKEAKDRDQQVDDTKEAKDRDQQVDDTKEAKARDQQVDDTQLTRPQQLLRKMLRHQHAADHSPQTKKPRWDKGEASLEEMEAALDVINELAETCLKKEMLSDAEADVADEGAAPGVPTPPRTLPPYSLVCAYRSQLRRSIANARGYRTK